MTDKIKVNQVVVVEGKYDAIKLDSLMEGLIIPVHGFSIFKDEEKKLLLKHLGEKNGIILITDSDTAGFKIRNYIQNICKKAEIINVYIPNINGKEPRKPQLSKEGFLGVEGVAKELLIKCLADAGVSTGSALKGEYGGITYLDLFSLNLSGTANSSQNRKKLCDKMGIPFKLSKKSFLEVLNRMTDIDKIQDIIMGNDVEIAAKCSTDCDDKKSPAKATDTTAKATDTTAKDADTTAKAADATAKDADATAKATDTTAKDEKPILFWDFHGTLTLHLHQWVDAAYELIDTNFPEIGVDKDTVHRQLDGQCLPWYTYPDRDTRHLIENDGWWTSCNQELFKMFIRCGLSEEQAELVYTKVRPYLVDPINNTLQDDTIKVLQELKKRGYKNYLASNNYPELDEVMDKLQLTEYFEKMVISARIGYDKPRKEFFEYAKDIAGNPKKCIMIGDNINDDIIGGKACGFKTIWITQKEVTNEAADYICNTLTDILNIL